MKKYQVSIRTANGVTTEIDTVMAPDGYTGYDYFVDCLMNAEEDYCMLLSMVEIIVTEV